MANNVNLSIHYRAVVLCFRDIQVEVSFNLLARTENEMYFYTKITKHCAGPDMPTYYSIFA